MQGGSYDRDLLSQHDIGAGALRRQQGEAKLKSRARPASPVTRCLALARHRPEFVDHLGTGHGRQRARLGVHALRDMLVDTIGPLSILQRS
ncbi:hypothetical protein [Tepidicella baoligensis]|uniref:hypothetical protein n=1 Tax=Tepidicella baoligensis TaxID=2707016 RepID=UPI0015D966C1|nr:hypothetical protein [Tepidicella baoligensis]